jgi:molecular chaperone IbpA
MRSTPLFRSSIGFDRMLSALDAASRVETIDNWPPYDIVGPARTTTASAWG